MTKVILMQEVFEEMKARLVNDQKLAEQASKDATDGILNLEELSKEENSVKTN